jgi:hypothetical protein
VDAGEQEPFAAAQPADRGVLERARIGLAAGDLVGDTLDDPLAQRDLAQQLVAPGRRRARNAGHDRTGLAAPAPGRGPRGGEHEPRPRAGVVPDRLGDVPVLLPAGHPEGGLGNPGDDRRERFGEGGELGRQAVGAAVAGSTPHLAPNGLEVAGVDAAPCRDGIGRAGLEDVDPGRHDGQSRSKRSTGRTKTVAPPTSTSSG